MVSASWYWPFSRNMSLVSLSAFMERGCLWLSVHWLVLETQLDHLAALSRNPSANSVLAKVYPTANVLGFSGPSVLCCSWKICCSSILACSHHSIFLCSA